MTIPQIIWPKESEEYKVVQFIDESSKKLYLRFAETNTQGHAYHAGIVKRFCEELGIKYDWKKFSDMADEVPVFLEDSPYKIVGAGACDVYLDHKVALFGDGSSGYKIDINEDHMKGLMLLEPAWIMKNNLFYKQRYKNRLEEYNSIDWGKRLIEIRKLYRIDEGSF